MRTPRRAVAVLLAAVLLPAVGGPGVAAADEQAETARRLAEAAGELEDSTEDVRRAAAQLRQVAVALPAAEREMSRSRGELAGAQAAAADASRAVRQAELTLAGTLRQVQSAEAEVAEGRRAINLLARRSYQAGGLGDLAAVLESGDPQTLVDRVATVQRVYTGLDDEVTRLTRLRLALTNARARLEARQDDLLAARDTALAGESRARDAASRATAAAARVQALVAQRKGALAAAEAGRAADLREYQRAQAASRALAARLKAEAEERRRNGTVGPRTGNGKMVWPADGPMTSRYGYRTHPIYGDRRFHAGIDIGAGSGTPISAGDDGVVVFAGRQGGYGNIVLISHGTEGGRELVTAYAHQSAILVSQGQRVRRGQTIGRVGSTGNSTGPHLHFETRLDGDPVDPLNYVSPP